MHILQSTTNKHHPLIQRFPAWSGECPEDCYADFTGSFTRNYFNNVLQQVNSVTLSSRNTFNTSPPLPPINNEEYFECIAFLSAIEKAKERFVMMELGAGFGRWLVRAAMAMRATRNMPFKLIGVEAEPRHFEWLLQHFRDNNISPDEHKLIRAAISNKDGLVSFTIGTAADWYGQSIVSDNSAESHKIYLNTNYPDSTIVEVPSITLASLLENETHVDLIDMDIQGVELDVVSSAQEQLNTKVKQIFIGTHGIDQECGLRNIFTKNEWFNVYDYPSNSE